MYRVLRPAYRLLGRIDVAAILLLTVLLLTAIGALFPQSSPSAQVDPEAHRPWLEALRGRYGTFTGLLTTIGAFHWYRSALFTAPVVLLTLSIAACTVQRWRPAWRGAFHHPILCSEAAFDRAPFFARGDLPGAPVAPSAVRATLEQHGFRVRSQHQGDLFWMRGDRNRLAPLGTMVSHLGVLLLLLAIGISSVFAWREEMTIEPGRGVEIEHGTGLTVRNQGFVISRRSDGSAAGYRADVVVAGDNQEARRTSIRVGEPATYGNVGLYLRGFAQTEAGSDLALLAVYDPGYAPFVVASLLLLLGMTVTLNFPHCWVRVRAQPDGMLCVAGRGDRRAWDFEMEFRAILRELRMSTRPAARG